jgi:hypothetical protein
MSRRLATSPRQSAGNRSRKFTLLGIAFALALSVAFTAQLAAPSAQQDSVALVHRGATHLVPGADSRTLVVLVDTTGDQRPDDVYILGLRDDVSSSPIGPLVPFRGPAVVTETGSRLLIEAGQHLFAFDVYDYARASNPPPASAQVIPLFGLARHPPAVDLTMADAERLYASPVYAPVGQ